MNIINSYIVCLQNTLEKISKSIYKKKSKKYVKLSKKIDRDLLEKYRLIERFMDEELRKN